MMRRIALLSCIAIALLGRSGLAQSDEQVETRKLVLDLATAFSNDGFKARDGNWSGTLHPKESLFLQVHLYAGNQYWFSLAGTPDKAKKLAVTVFDESGKAVQGDTYQEGSKAAAGIEADASGSYYIRVQELEGEPTSFTLIYSYK